MSNPYESPQTPFPASGTPGEGRDKLRRVAKYQRWALFALLANIITNIVSFASQRAESATLAIVIMVVALAIVVFTMVAVFLLAQEVTNTGVAILCTVLMCVPCISLITLLVLNQKATTYLQQHGLKVGLMGTDPNSI